ncbi:MAG TPA: erythromycin esterase family protein [Vicinamibacterales bacterium]|jgi:erythromycin esterase-like protein|nr:erythromycin esterase family protein [Vicinamibacterales bacterium]
MNAHEALDAVRHAALWFTPSEDGLGPLLDLIGDASIVLVGEATHGTDEFYRIRAELTRALIRSKQFNVVAVEADWPDAYRVNRWVTHATHENGPEAALDDFVRFPRWMWRNTVVVDFIDWLRSYNAKRMATDRAGLYGLDLYSLHASMDAVLKYLAKVDPEGAARARRRYSCFEEFGTDPAQAYGYAATLGLSRSCENDVVAQLLELRKAAAAYASRDGRVAEDDYFFAEQNARLVRNAERYYRTMFGGHVESWNLRDTHMMETLDALLAWTAKRAGYARAVVWAHNSHLGDARATQMADWGELNLGQLARERHGDRTFLIGFTTHTGTVTAAREWDEPAERRGVTPSLQGSYEHLFHDAGLDRFVLPTLHAREALGVSRLERAIGVVYKPETERASHYFRAKLGQQFDAVIHVDTTSALTPLERSSREDADLPETYPSGV